MRRVRKYFKEFPGSKHHPDSFLCLRIAVDAVDVVTGKLVPTGMRSARKERESVSGLSCGPWGVHWVSKEEV